MTAHRDLLVRPAWASSGPASRHVPRFLTWLWTVPLLGQDGVAGNRLLIVPFMLRRRSRNPVLEKGLLSWWHVSWNIPAELVLRNKSALSASVCTYGTEGLLFWKAVCMIWSIRNGAERLRCLPGICITISGIHCYLL